MFGLLQKFEKQFFVWENTNGLENWGVKYLKQIESLKNDATDIAVST